MTTKPYSFSFATSPEGFDNHINASIRGYDILNDNIVSISKYFIEPQTNVYDLGCSTGTLINQLQKTNTDAEYYGIELCKDFAHIPNDNITYLQQDIRDTDISNASFITSIFTLQFIGYEYRMQILEKIYQGLNVGGGLIVAEKILAENSRTQDILTSTYYDYKSQTFTPQEIFDKERQLRSMLKPMLLNDLTDMLREVGFKDVQSFWQSYLFVGLLAIK